MVWIVSQRNKYSISAGVLFSKYFNDYILLMLMAWIVSLRNKYSIIDWEFGYYVNGMDCFAEEQILH